MSRVSRRLAALLRRVDARLRPVPGWQLGAQQECDWRAPLEDRLLKRLERLTLAPRQPARGGAGGEHRSRARSTSSDFVDYRPYRPGDDTRQIDWNAYGRLDQLYVKLTEGRERSTLSILLDRSASMAAGSPSKFDFARQLAAVLGYVALARYDRVNVLGLGGSGPVLRPLRGRQRFAELVAGLDGMRPGGSLALADALVRLDPTRARGQAVLISDLLDPAGCEQGLAALAAAGLEPMVVQVLSPQELEPDLEGDLELVDVESGEAVLVGVTRAAVRVYQRRLADWCARIEQHCRARAWRYVRFTSTEPIERAALVGLRVAGMTA